MNLCGLNCVWGGGVNGDGQTGKKRLVEYNFLILQIISENWITDNQTWMVLNKIMKIQTTYFLQWQFLNGLTPLLTHITD